MRSGTDRNSVNTQGIVVTQKSAAQRENSLSLTPLSSSFDWSKILSTGARLVKFDRRAHSCSKNKTSSKMFYTASIVALAALSLCIVYRNRVYAAYASLKFLVNGRRMLIEAAEKVSQYDASVATSY